MAYISSDKIKVFPSIGRKSEIDADAELMNEGNVSSIIRSLCRERKSYVLSKEFSASDENPFEFVIYGFYFKITDVSSLSDRPLYAHITLKENTGNYQLLTISNSTVSNNSLQILDQNVGQSSQFQGVWFDKSSSGGTYTLQLLDAEGNIPVTSLLHTETNEILDKGTSNYISDSFTTASLSTTNATIGRELVVKGDTSLGDTTLGDTTMRTLTVKEGATLGDTTLSTLAVSGETKLGTLTVTGSTSLASTTISTLTVTGDTEVYDYALDVRGKAALNDAVIGTLLVGGKTELKGSVDARDHTITAATFIGSLSGNAATASKFNSNRTITLTGPVTGTSSSSTGNHTISTSITVSAVTTSTIADGAVTTAKITNNAVTTDKIADGAIATKDLADNAVTTAKIGFGVTMTLTVDDENETLVLSAPKLTDLE